MKRTLGKYKITYQSGVVQFKDLVSHDTFLNDIKPKQEEIYALESKGKKDKAKKLKDLMKEWYGDEWFTDRSPLFRAVETGTLNLPKTQGGVTKCSVIRHT